MLHSAIRNPRSLVLMILILAVVACGAPQPTSAPAAAANTAAPPTDTPIPPTDTAVPPTETPAPPTSTPTPVPPTDTPSPTAKPTREPETLATRAEEIVGEYSIPESSFSAGDGQLWLFLREDGTGGVGYYSALGAQRPADFSASWSLEDGIFKLAYIGSCDTDYNYNNTEKEGVVGSYEVHYRLLGGDRPAELRFTRIEDECFWNSKILTERPWKRYEP